MKIYISGAISNDPDFKRKFARAENCLRRKGFTVINPARTPKGLTYQQYIDMGLHQLSLCDAIYVLDGEYSKGVSLEVTYASTVGKRILYERREEHTKDKRRILWEAD